MMKPSELLNVSIAGGFLLCCVKDASHFGRAMRLEIVHDTWSTTTRALSNRALVMVEQIMTTSKNRMIGHAKCSPSADTVPRLAPHLQVS